MIKQWIKRSLRRLLAPTICEILADARLTPSETEARILRKQVDETSAVDKGVQVSLSMQYKELLRNKRPLPSLDEVEFRAFSQNGEDGILLYIFSLIGTTNKKCVEICAGDGIECNTANLIINHGWQGLMFDGNPRNVETGKNFYAKCRDTFLWPPKLVHAWITTETVDALIRAHGFSGQIDLLSLDIDGNDYWIWEAIECIQPRVVMLEYQNSWGHDHSVTQRYQPNYVWKPDTLCGASLPAFAKLGRKKGYRLVGSNRLCINAAFLRDGVGEEILPEVSAELCFEHPLPQHNIRYHIQRERAKLLERDWIRV